MMVDISCGGDGVSVLFFLEALAAVFTHHLACASYGVALLSSATLHSYGLMTVEIGCGWV